MSLLTKASLLLTPNAYKANTIYCIIPSDGSGDLAYTRTSTSTRVNSVGVVEAISNGVPPLDYSDSLTSPCWLFEPSRTNSLLNSATLSTQSVTTTAVPYSLSFYGTGTIVLSGSATGTFVGSGVSNRSKFTFTPTAGTLTLTVSGTCTNAQLEAGSYATSYIVTTTSTRTRSGYTASETTASSSIGQTEGVMFAESAALFNDLTTRHISISNGTTTNRLSLFYSNVSNRISVSMISGGTTIISSISYDIADTTQFCKMAVRYSNTLGVSLWVNGVNRASSIATTLPISMTRFGFDNASSTVFLGKVKNAGLYNTYLSDAEMATLTTL